MKRKIFFLILLGLLFSSPAQSQEIRVMTYNIKYDNTRDTVNNWEDRKSAMVRLIQYYLPQVLGVQEALHRQVDYLDKALPSYAYVGVGRDDGAQKGEYAALFYDSAKLHVERSNTFWLSETPEQVSVGWDAALERICTYALFRHTESQKRFWVFNAHFDHRGKQAREKSAQLILERIRELNKNNLPVVLMGDLNLAPETPPILEIKEQMEDGLETAQRPFYGPLGTFNGFDPDRVLDRRIDYIFVRNAKVMEYLHIDDRMANSKHISDHLPVSCVLSLP
ncbi:MAG: endonuclease/exonuclease/phosphatase family protein [Bacteroidota bacterium]